MSVDLPPRKYSRNEILRLGGLGILGLLITPGCSATAQKKPTENVLPVATSLEVCLTPEELYRRLDQYRNKVLPPELVKGIASDLTSLTQYPSFVSSGRLISKSFNGPDSLVSEDPNFSNLIKPIGISFAEIGFNVAEYSDLGDVVVTEPQILKKKTDGLITFSGIRSVTSNLLIRLNEGNLRLKASPWLIRLMIAKEASHPLYFSKARELLLADLRSYYEVPEDQDISNILMEMAINIESPKLRIPSLSPVFMTLAKRIDYGAGYWHITADLAKINQEGKLTPIDKDILRINLVIIQEAINRKLLVQSQSVSRGVNFVWAEGVGPFSEQWFQLVMEVQRRYGHN